MSVSSRVHSHLYGMLKHLGLPYVIKSIPMDGRVLERHRTDLMVLTRSLRGKRDPEVFLLHYNVNMLLKYDDLTLRRRLFHEILHALTWQFTDELHAMAQQVPYIPLRKELLRRAHNTREMVTYTLERSLGPKVFPELHWEDTD